jgi:hypothetical protein
MDVGLDQPRTGEASLGVINLGLASERGLEGDDATSFHPNVDEFVRWPIGKTRVADDEIHVRFTPP